MLDFFLYEALFFHIKKMMAPDEKVQENCMKRKQNKELHVFPVKDFLRKIINYHYVLYCLSWRINFIINFCNQQQ